MAGFAEEEGNKLLKDTSVLDVRVDSDDHIGFEHNLDNREAGKKGYIGIEYKPGTKEITSINVVDAEGNEMTIKDSKKIAEFKKNVLDGKQFEGNSFDDVRQKQIDNLAKSQPDAYKEPLDVAKKLLANPEKPLNVSVFYNKMSDGSPDFDQITLRMDDNRGGPNVTVRYKPGTQEIDKVFVQNHSGGDSKEVTDPKVKAEIGEMASKQKVSIYSNPDAKDVKSTEEIRNEWKEKASERDRTNEESDKKKGEQASIEPPEHLRDAVSKARSSVASNLKVQDNGQSTPDVNVIGGGQSVSGPARIA